MIDRQTLNMTYSSSVAHQHTALLALQDCSMPPIAMEADTAYQGYLPSCKLHSRSLTVGRTGACDLEIAHMWFTQSRDCARVTQSRDCAHVLRNPEIGCTISGFREYATQSRDCANSQIARNIYIHTYIHTRPPPVFLLRFSTIHGSGRAAKNGKSI